MPTDKVEQATDVPMISVAYKIKPASQASLASQKKAAALKYRAPKQNPLPRKPGAAQ